MGLKQVRAQIDKDLGNSADRQFFSPAVYSQYQVTLPLIRANARGRFIDLGCGEMPYRPYVEPQTDEYHTFDIEERTAGVTYVGDIQSMPQVPSAYYDTAVSLEVFEHVPDPRAAAAEVFRVLQPGGTFIMSVPHMSRLHEEPYDFFRYTKYGVRRILEDAGFTDVEVTKRGGLLSFVGHQVSTAILTLTWRIPGVRRLGWTLNKWLVTRLAYSVDSRLDRGGLFAMGYTAIAKKPA
ncbi:hypothetical protein GCM10009798_23840 [Nocardioides panacihumi]|uniref:Class I SAM-dependent methyltransferase n=1 Tax=Nocardioides panacihumi TaxID=400774 RepID=A0ABP5CGE3_9ACTN